MWRLYIIGYLIKISHIISPPVFFVYHVSLILLNSSQIIFRRILPHSSCTFLVFPTSSWDSISISPPVVMVGVRFSRLPSIVKDLWRYLPSTWTTGRPWWWSPVSCIDRTPLERSTLGFLMWGSGWERGGEQEDDHEKYRFRLDFSHIPRVTYTLDRSIGPPMESRLSFDPFISLP